MSALLWISTGLARAFTDLEKGSTYYLASHWFHVKMILLVGIVGLEIVPMITLIRWRREMRRAAEPDTARAGMIARISIAQGLLIVAMAVAATAMAHGIAAAP